MSVDSNKRIAKNTLYLYVRMIVTMLVTLYTVRVVLAALGEEDYGIYNVIGGIIVLFSFLNTAMSNASQRFLSFNIGRGDKEQLSKTFSMSVTCHLFLSVLVLFLAETVGLWFVLTQLNIPSERQNAAIWVYQFSVATFIANILRVPYNASVISHEKMSFYAYLSIADVFMNLGIVYLLIVSSYDKLILYAVLKFFISLFIWFVNYLYCRKSFECCDYHPYWNTPLFVKLVGFSGWSMVGGGSVLVTQSGNNILLNIFQGVSMNAAYGIANQVSAAVYGFVSNFQLAFRPQIVKLYAEGKKEEQVLLINRAAKFSYFLFLIISVPFIVKADFVLSLWLKDVPSYAVEFCQWMLAYSLIDAIQAPLWMAIGATGNIKNYTIWSSFLAICSLPATWFILYLGYSPVWIFIVRFIINFIAAIIRIFYVKSFLEFPISLYFSKVLCKALPITFLSFGITYIVSIITVNNLSSFVFVVIFSILISVFLVFGIGLTKEERKVLINYFRKRAIL